MRSNKTSTTKVTYNGDYHEQERRCDSHEHVGIVCLPIQEVAHLEIHIVSEHREEYACRWDRGEDR